ncbi:MAG: hypothetical protein PHU85_16845, partial [Phycisphaerae bacterium]|nr:hypothetical protein [Phycisphaerae bacterium]
WLLCYNARLENDRFSGIGPANLPPNTATDQIVLLIAVPANTSLFKLDLGGGEQILVDVSAGK